MPQALPRDRDVGDPKWRQLSYPKWKHLSLTMAHRAGRSPFQRPQDHRSEGGTQAGIGRSITSRAKLEEPIITPSTLSGCAVGTPKRLKMPAHHGKDWGHLYLFPSYLQWGKGGKMSPRLLVGVHYFKDLEKKG